MKILQSQTKLAEYMRNIHYATPEHGSRVEDLLDPETWAHVAQSFKPNDRIEAVPASGEWFAEFYVSKVDVKGLHLVLLRQHSLIAQQVERADDDEPIYSVQFGGADKWRVLRKSDKAVMAKGMATKDEAQKWIADNA